MSKSIFSILSGEIDEETLAELEEPKRQYGVVTGRVVNPVDLTGQGRVQVQLPWIDSIDLSPWARIAVPMAGKFSGTYFIPNIDDEVLVAFEHGDVNAPYIIGSLWNAFSPPPMPTPIPQIRAIRTVTGNQVVFTEAPPTVTIQNAPTAPVAMPSPPSPVGPYQTILLMSDGIKIAGTGVEIMCGDTVVSIRPGAVMIRASTLTVEATGALTISAGTINMVGSTSVSITSPLVKIN